MTAVFGKWKTEVLRVAYFPANWSSRRHASSIWMVSLLTASGIFAILGFKSTLKIEALAGNNVFVFSDASNTFSASFFCYFQTRPCGTFRTKIVESTSCGKSSASGWRLSFGFEIKKVPGLDIWSMNDSFLPIFFSEAVFWLVRCTDLTADKVVKHAVSSPLWTVLLFGWLHSVIVVTHLSAFPLTR